MSRKRINLVGGIAVGAAALSGSLLALVPVFTDVRADAARALVAADADALVRAELAELAKEGSNVTVLRGDLDRLRGQITGQDELLDASALASAAAKSAGARIVAITFADRQAFAPPTGLGMGDDGTQAVPQATAEPETQRFQLPVSFEVEVSSTAQAAAFVEGLRAGPRMLQVVQAQASPTNNAQRYTLTVDALIFSAKG